MSLPLYQVDAFTNTAFAGNPAAVCVHSGEQSPTWMQNVAAEMNLSETAFLQPQRSGNFRLRWFTPTHEVQLCGHATLASAHVLWTEGYLAPEAAATFETKAGTLTATRTNEWITMNLPTDPVRPIDPPSELLQALGLTDPIFSGRSERDYIFHCASPDVVRALSPEMASLATHKARGVIVTAEAHEDEVDFVSRFFAPRVGVPEDPVTGSAHCALGPYWAAQKSRTTLTARQLSDRGGTLHVGLESAQAERIELSGQARTVLRGRLLHDPSSIPENNAGSL